MHLGDPLLPSLSLALCADPSLWSVLHVQRWLELVSREQGLRTLDPSGLRHLDGRGLCRMSREELQQLGVGPYEADVLLTSLTYMRRGQCLTRAPPHLLPTSSPPLCSVLHFVWSEICREKVKCLRMFPARAVLRMSHRLRSLLTSVDSVFSVWEL